MTPKEREIIRLAYRSTNPELRRRALLQLQTAADKRLPKQPHAVMQEAREEGLIAGDDEEEIEAVTLFDSPDESKEKKASLNSGDRELVRIAHAASSPGLRRRIVKLLRAAIS